MMDKRHEKSTALSIQHVKRGDGKENKDIETVVKMEGDCKNERQKRKK